MSSKFKKRLLGILIIVGVICSLLLFGLGPERFPDPIMTEYIIKVVFYPAVIGVVVLGWKLTLDNKISGKKEREKRLNDLKEENEH